MAVCGGCGEQSSRTKTILTDDKGNLLKKPIEFCKLCKPEEFERWQDPSNKKGAWAFQAEPHKYIKRYREDGMVVYEGKDETRADLEDQLAKPAADDMAKYEAALERKRRTRRTTPLTPAELERFANLDRERQKQAVQ